VWSPTGTQLSREKPRAIARRIAIKETMRAAEGR
jgi:hypothetical protein